MLALGVDSVGSPKDHEAFLRVGEALIILVHRASFLGRLLLAFPFLWLGGLPHEALKELTIFVEVFDAIGMVGAWTLHELVEVVGLALLGLLARAIGHGDNQSWSVGADPSCSFFPFVWRGPRLGPCAWPCPCPSLH